jgi:hypothetical protein
MDYGITPTSTSSFCRDFEGVVFRLVVGDVEILPSSATNANPALLILAEAIARETSGKTRTAVA